MSVIDQVLKSAGEHAARIAAVASDTFWHNVIGVDADGQAITPLYTWADTRNARAADALRQRLDEAAIHRRTGCYLHTMYLPAKFAWLAETQPEIMRRARHWMSFAEYFTAQCFGRPACSLSMASGTGLLNLNDRTWDAALLRELPVSADQLSPLVDVDQPMTGLLPEYAQRWPALATLPWYPGNRRWRGEQYRQRRHEPAPHRRECGHLHGDARGGGLEYRSACRTACGPTAWTGGTRWSVARKATAAMSGHGSRSGCALTMTRRAQRRLPLCHPTGMA